MEFDSSSIELADADTDLTSEELDSIDHLQLVLNIAQSRLNDLMVKSINDEAIFRKEITDLKKEKQKLQNEVIRLTPGKHITDDGGGKSQITMTTQ